MATTPGSFQAVFERLRTILHAHAEEFTVSDDTSGRYGLEAAVGDATVRAWGGKVKTARMPIAWIEIGKNYVSYHLMGLNGNGRLTASMSELLRARMQGRTCFNFKAVDDTLVTELQRVTADSLRGLKKAGFIA